MATRRPELARPTSALGHERRGCSGLFLTVMAFPIIGGTSIFGGKATIVGSYLGAYLIGKIEAGLVATGMRGFWVRAVVGLVFLAAVVFQLTMEDPTRRRRLRSSASPAGFSAGPRRAPGSHPSGADDLAVALPVG